MTGIGSICSGVGRLDVAVANHLGADSKWFTEIEDGPSHVLSSRFPTVPNLGDVTKVDWAEAPLVQVITGGTPCQDLSSAGQRQGMTRSTRSGLWYSMRSAIQSIRPRIVVWENVKGALSAAADSNVEPDPGGVGVPLRAVGRVLGDLADDGYDARWATVPAHAVGAPHGRERVFVVGVRRDAPWPHAPLPWVTRRRPSDLLPTPTASVAFGTRGYLEDGVTKYSPRSGRTLVDATHPVRFPHHASAIKRWEAKFGAAPPERVGGKLNPRFAEWMMGWPSGWVTDLLPHSQALKAIGNGVVDLQAEYALSILIPRGNQ